MTLAAIGIILLGSVQQRIINEYGYFFFREKRIIDVYWYDLEKEERWRFWIGLLLLSLPFVALGVWRLFILLSSQ